MSVAQSISDNTAIDSALPVLWTKPYFYLMGPISQNQAQQFNQACQMAAPGQSLTSMIALS